VSTYELALPPLEEQRRIAEVLGALDDAIESLARSERLLLDYGLTQWEITLESTEARPMRVDEMATFENRKRIPLSQIERDMRPGPYPYYGANGIFGYVDDYLFDGFRVLVGEDGSVIEDDGTPVLQLAHGKYWVNNHAHVLTGRAVPTEALWFLLRNLAVSPAVTGAVQPKLSMGRLAALEVLVPAESSEFFQIAKECIAQVLHRRNQLRDMAETRDFLLPRLVSGELRVSAAEELVEAAT
jgi:type I restriction enzyme S subunit